MGWAGWAQRRKTRSELRDAMVEMDQLCTYASGRLDSEAVSTEDHAEMDAAIRLAHERYLLLRKAAGMQVSGGGPPGEVPSEPVA